MVPFMAYWSNSEISKKKLKKFREHRISACDFLNNGIAESRNIFMEKVYLLENVFKQNPVVVSNK